MVLGRLTFLSLLSLWCVSVNYSCCNIWVFYFLSIEFSSLLSYNSVSLLSCQDVSSPIPVCCSISPVSHVYSMFPPARHVSLSLSRDPLSLPSCVPSIPLSTAFPPVSSSCVGLRLCVSCFILIILWSIFFVFSFAFPVASCLCQLVCPGVSTYLITLLCI